MRRAGTLAGFSLISVVIMAIAWWSGDAWAWRIGWVAVVLTALTVVAQAAPLHRIRVERRLPSGPLAAGADVEIAMHLCLPPWWPWWYIAVEEELPGALAAESGRPRTVALPGFRRDATVRYTLLRVPRGIHAFHRVILVTGDPWGLVQRRRFVPLPGFLEVWPAPRPTVLPDRRTGGDGRDARGRLVGLSAASIEIVSIRAMAPGDQWNRIHWPSTARTGQFMVKQLAAWPPAALMVAVDAPEQFERVDYEAALSIAAGWITEATRRGQRVGLQLVASDMPELPARTGSRHHARLMRQLAALRYDARDRSVRASYEGLDPAAILITGSRTTSTATSRRMPVLIVGDPPNPLTPAAESLGHRP